MTQPILSSEHATIQQAIDLSILQKRPCVIVPGIHSLSQKLIVRDASDWSLHIAGELRAAADMDVLLDIEGMAYSSVEGGLFSTAAGVTVGTMVRYWWDGTGRSSTRNRFSDLHITGQYQTGLQVGSSDNGLQTDHTTYHNLTFGGGVNHHATLWQRAIYLVQSVFANTMLHDFYGVSFGAHQTAVRIDKVRQVQFFGGGPSGCAVDFDVRATDYVGLYNVRSENGGKFLVANSGGQSWGHNIALFGCNFDAPSATMNNPIIDFTQGTLNITGLQIDGMPTNTLPRFKFGYGQRKAFVHINGLRVSTNAALANVSDLFDTNDKAHVTATGIIKADASGGQVDAECVETYRVSAGQVV